MTVKQLTVINVETVLKITTKRTFYRNTYRQT